MLLFKSDANVAFFFYIQIIFTTFLCPTVIRILFRVTYNLFLSLHLKIF
jgi:hypothetical protein